MKISGETVLRVTGAGPHNITWEGYGFHLIVPHGAVPEDVTISVAVEAFLPIAGKLKLPENIHLVSAIYEVSSSEVFHKNVSIEIQHYAAISSDQEATCYGFIKGRYSHKDVSYSFETLNGKFSTRSQLATISMKQFCLLAVASNISCQFIKGRHSYKSPNLRGMDISDDNFLVPSRLNTILTIDPEASVPMKKYQFAGHAYHKYNPGHPTSLDMVFLLTPSLEVYEKVW